MSTIQNLKNTVAEIHESEHARSAWIVASSLMGFAVLWLIFFALYEGLPYLSSGAAVVYRVKIKQEVQGTVFPSGPAKVRIMIFGNSKVLAGFIPDRFDTLAAHDGLSAVSYNSGYPARDSFVPELSRIISHGQVPQVLLLTSLWKAGNQRFDPFKVVTDDHEMAGILFPFRFLIRDTFSFLITSREHGGPLEFYRKCRNNVGTMLQDRGYYFIEEQSHYRGNSLPDDYKLPTDTPNSVISRMGDPDASELRELNRLIVQNKIHCYYVPTYRRQNEAAAPPSTNQAFADLLQHYSECKSIGPDYFLYPNRIFSDEAHLNRDGAQVYTDSLYQLLVEVLKKAV
jgi:hypothetical protein